VREQRPTSVEWAATCEESAQSDESGSQANKPGCSQRVSEVQPKVEAGDRSVLGYLERSRKTSRPSAITQFEGWRGTVEPIRPYAGT
jgi:hypothetical protein